MVPTYLDGVHAQGHAVQVFHGEVRVAASPDAGTCLLNFLAHAGLVLGVPGELVQEECERG